MELTDLGGSFVRPQSAKDVELVLEHDQLRGPVLSIGMKPKAVSARLRSRRRCC